MRFMILIKADSNSESGAMPDERLLTEMGKFNEELVKAGVMLAGEGLHPSSKGARVRFSGSKRTVIDGPFTETKELIAGFWLWQMKSRDASRRCCLPALTRAGDGDQEIGEVAACRRASRLQGPGPAADRYSQMKQKRTAGTPPLSTGQKPCGACPTK